MILFQSVGQIAVVFLVFSVLVFVHELGHFLAAKAVGVRVEKFFIGFDAWGIGLKKKIGGCVYGIGILPLGGYVKLAGQSDDPRDTNIKGAPDELVSKPLWAQGFVFIAGVMMNFIFGYLILVAGYMHGIPFEPNIVGKVEPGQSAEVAGLRTGDKIVAVKRDKPDAAKYEVNTFIDVAGFIALNAGDQMRLIVERPNQKNPQEPEKLSIVVKGERNYSMRGGLTTIGINPPRGRTIVALPEKESPDYKNIGALKVGDKILKIGDQDIIDDMHGHVLEDEARKHPNAKLAVVAERDGKQFTTEIFVSAAGLYDAGFGVYAHFTKVSKNSPAERAGLKAEDKVYAYDNNGEKKLLRGNPDLVKVIKSCKLLPINIEFERDGKHVTGKITPKFMGKDSRVKLGTDTFLGITTQKTDDGYTVDTVFTDGPSANILQAGDVLKTLSGKKISGKSSLSAQVTKNAIEAVTFYVDGKDKPITLKPKVSTMTGIPRIGVVLGREKIISKVQKGSEAEKQGIIAGSHLAGFMISPDLKTVAIRFIKPEDLNPPRKWGIFNAKKQQTQVRLNVPQHVQDNPTKAGLVGFAYFRLDNTKIIRKFSGAPAFKLAAHKALDMSSQIFLIIPKLINKKIGIDAMGGPIQIFKTIKRATSQGLGMLIWLAALLSINLGVINILPIPVFDGGHVLFLIIEFFYELVRGGKANKAGLMKIKEISQYAGTIAILLLMLTVTYFDIINW